ncbi:MAG: hypothetical protein A2078_13060 [Nitrospirae bacterium GWC2_57_9]|nr:MAG: hypothetical protein A2078_13060 [Nitrospirae bacterium GWC2_57_9]
MEWVFREGVDFICDNCKSFTVPAKGLYLALTKIHARSLDFYDEDPVRKHLVETFCMTDELWKAYGEGRLGHIPFVYTERGELVWDQEEGPEMLSCDEVVFKFRPKCVCDGIYKRMYENIN